jgi:cytochrome c biogenesis protein CcdA
VTTALLGLGGLAFADSLNVFNVGAVWSIVNDCRKGHRSPTAGALSFIAGLYVFTACYGLCMVLGLDAVTRKVDFEVTPGVRYPVELTVGIVILVLAYVLPSTHSAAPRRKSRLFPRRPWTLSFVGMGAGATQAPLSLPYLTLIGALAAQETLPPGWPLLILGYAAVIQVPALLVLLLATRRAAWTHRCQLSIALWFSRNGWRAVRIILVAVGVALATDALVHHAAW